MIGELPPDMLNVKQALMAGVSRVALARIPGGKRHLGQITCGELSFVKLRISSFGASWLSSFREPSEAMRLLIFRELRSCFGSLVMASCRVCKSS
jgi:hypothetical protein